MTQHFVIKPVTESNPKEASIVLTPPQAAPSIPILSGNIPIVFSQPSKESLAKLKQLKPLTGTNNKKLYVQALKLNVEDIIHIKDAFLSLPLKKIMEVNNILNTSKLVKPHIKMTTKEPLRKQIIIPMD